MKPMPNLMEAEDIEVIGAAEITEFTWKQLFDTDACTICGRCTSVCPANITGKPLDPREIVFKTGEVMAATGHPPRVARRSASRTGIVIESERVLDRVQPEEVWSCTIVQGVRRDLPGEHRDPRQDPRHAPVPGAHGIELPHGAGQGLHGHGEPGQPMGNGSTRPSGDWTKKLDFDVKILGEDGVDSAEYLWYVGCAGSFDDRNQAVTISLAKLLNEAEYRLRNPRAQGDVQRRSGSAVGQRVRLAAARAAEHRDLRRPRREEGHHPVPALLQHARQRVSADGWRLRGGPSHRVAGRAAPAEAGEAPRQGTRCRRRRSPTTTPAIWASQ